MKNIDSILHSLAFAGLVWSTVATVPSFAQTSPDATEPQAASAPAAPEEAPSSLAATSPEPDRPAAVGALEVTTDPPGASVSIDGRPVGVTPLRVGELPAGSYRVTIAQMDRPTVEREVQIQEYVTARLGTDVTVDSPKPGPWRVEALSPPSPTPKKPTPPASAPRETSRLPEGGLFSTLLAQPWAWAGVAFAGVTLLVAVLLITTSAPASLLLVGPYLKSVRESWWKLIQIGALALAGLTGLATVAMFLGPSIPLNKYPRLFDVGKLFGKKADRTPDATPKD